ncbi:MAG: GAF domain-containing protein [Hamadaea sp.]|uniref:GAF domain-containing protein n=1 Tax=Hamadaea sp. TaxID=2024425 RepID=UPI001845DF6E|nr:helix-turn-helix domain-containing protein [Hamadaea sp.]NUR74333.1 GAF domain-containing protein [Hamadaea sp.]NUT24051.1 GAF domain-containing protein [Hamadaea sp.]
MHSPYLADPGTEHKERAGEIARAHEAFLSGATPDELGVRPVVAQSWQRSQRAQVNPDRTPPIVLADAELQAYRDDHLLSSVLPVLRELVGRVAEADRHLMSISDAQGRLLWVDGHKIVRDIGEQIHFVEGAIWDERFAGTNAPGTALALDEAVQIFATEHYSVPVHPWTCAAAPIHDPATGEILGIIDVTGGDVVAHPHSLALVKAAARAAEAELSWRRNPEAGLWLPEQRATARLAALNRSEGILHAGGRRVRLSRRHTEILILLREHPEGMTGDQLADALYDFANPTTLRVEINRLRRSVGELVRSRPYRLAEELEADYADVRDALERGDTAAAATAYAGPLLPMSEARGVAELRDLLDARMRCAVLSSEDPALLEAWATKHGGEDLEIWERLATSRRAAPAQQTLARTQVRRLRAEYGLAPNGATFLQRPPR